MDLLYWSGLEHRLLRQMARLCILILSLPTVVPTRINTSESQFLIDEIKIIITLEGFLSACEKHLGFCKDSILGS